MVPILMAENAFRPEGASQPASAEALFGTLQDIFATGLAAIDAAGANVDATTGEHATAAGCSPKATDLAPLASRALLAAAASSIRYWRDLAALCSRHQGGLLQSVGAVPRPRTEQETRIAADELRAFLREAGDVATLEAQLLRQELTALGQSVADSLSTPDAEPVRRWRAKA